MSLELLLRVHAPIAKLGVHAGNKAAHLSWHPLTCRSMIRSGSPNRNLPLLPLPLLRKLHSLMPPLLKPGSLPGMHFPPAPRTIYISIASQTPDRRIFQTNSTPRISVFVGVIRAGREAIGRFGWLGGGHGGEDVVVGG